MRGKANVKGVFQSQQQSGAWLGDAKLGYERRKFSASDVLQRNVKRRWVITLFVDNLLTFMTNRNCGKSSNLKDQ